MASSRSGQKHSGQAGSLIRPNGKPRMSVAAVFDGAPDDQLMPAGSPDRLHVLAVVLAPSLDYIMRFCSAIAAESGEPLVLKGKWNRKNASNRRRVHYHRCFFEGFSKATRQFARVGFYWTKFRESEIRAILPEMEAMLIKAGCRRVEGSSLWRTPAHLSHAGVTVRGGVAPLSTIAVALKIATVLAHLYNICTKMVGHRPYLTLHTDRLPNDPNDAALGLVDHELNVMSNMRTRVQWTNPQRQGGDLPVDHLADALCSWILAAETQPDSIEAKALAEITPLLEKENRLAQIVPTGQEEGRGEDAIKLADTPDRVSGFVPGAS
jgi:hypothetical protein